MPRWPRSINPESEPKEVPMSMNLNCKEAHALLSPYLDSELDTASTLAVRQHLADCSDCARASRAEAGWQQRLEAALSHGARTDTLWERVERQVGRAVQPGEPLAREPRSPAVVREGAGTAGWRFWLWPSPGLYAGLAGAWIVILAFQGASLEVGPVAASPRARGSRRPGRATPAVGGVVGRAGAPNRASPRSTAADERGPLPRQESSLKPWSTH